MSACIRTTGMIENTRKNGKGLPMEQQAGDAGPTTQSQPLAVRPYAPEGGFDPTGLLISIVAMLLAAAVTGFAAHLISQWIYLIFVFPVGIGLAVGYVGSAMAGRFKVRSPAMAGLAGFLGGVVAMASMHFFDYQTVRSLVEDWPAEEKAFCQVSEAEFGEMVQKGTPQEKEDAWLEYKVYRASRSLPAFMDFQAEQGVELKRAGSGDKTKGINLGYVGSWIYWVVEILLVAFLTYSVVKGRASEPFCRRCQQWKQQRVLGSVGTDVQGAAGALRSGDLARIRKHGSGIPDKSTEVIAYVCPRCDSAGEVDVKLNVVTVEKKKTKKTTVAFLTYPPDSLPLLAGAFRPPGAT